MDSHGSDATSLETIDIEKIEQALHEFFPGALTSEECVHKIQAAMQVHGFTAENTLFASSVCVDEINHEHGDITDLLISNWGECFYMGGLGGLPFVGKTGFAAYSHHAPVNGNLFILFGPHVGISPNGVVGKYYRKGQESMDYACGAAIGAYNVLAKQQGAFVAPSTSAGLDLDYQLNTITSQLQSHYATINSANNPMAALNYAMFEVIISLSPV